MDFLNLLENRYTTKYYDPNKKIPKEIFDKILKSLVLTPSSVNLQPWEFVYVDDKAGKDKVRACIKDFNMQRFDNCSHVLFILSYKNLDEKYLQQVLDKEEQDGRLPDAKIKEAQAASRHFFSSLHEQEGPEGFVNWTGKQSYIALGTALYAAASYNVDSTAVEGIDYQMADKVLNLENTNLHTQVVVFFGYKDEHDSNVLSIRPKSRISFNNKVRKI